MQQILTIRRPDDFHVHFRQNAMLEFVAKYTARHFARARVMPNLLPPILTGQYAKQYETFIRKVCARYPDFEPLMTIKLTDSTTPKDIYVAYELGIKAAKLYPVGVTTNSDDGVSDLQAMYPVFEAMADVGMVLCIHGELPGASVLDAEELYLFKIKSICRDFPGLKVILEHVSTVAAVKLVQDDGLSNLAATITLHHLLLTIDEVVGHPHHFCKPVAKTEKDRIALLVAATSGDERFFFGSDSAPHPRETKEAANCNAGVFSAPVALSLLAQVFEERDALDRLEDFVSRFGAEFNELPLNEGTIALEYFKWRVPTDYDGIVPFYAGKEVNYRVVPNY